MWTKKYKKSINCKRPRGFSQKQYCKYTRKVGKQVGRIPNGVGASPIIIR
jgi:hypothetical protein